ncbi:hypothetical protein EI94DRAFT_1728655 [Lactarius quietus]|nr:hypothetical protein EI94DRAFT_1728655 [Lactarius quietus]
MLQPRPLAFRLLLLSSHRDFIEAISDSRCIACPCSNDLATTLREYSVLGFGAFPHDRSSSSLRDLSEICLLAFPFDRLALALVSAIEHRDSLIMGSCNFVQYLLAHTDSNKYKVLSYC